MNENSWICIITVAIIGGLTFLVLRFWRSTKTALARVGIGFISLIDVSILLLLGLFLNGLYLLNTPVNTSETPMAHIGSDSVQVARGEKLANLCAGCHSSTGKLPLDGGSINYLGGGIMGSIYAPNLTSAGSTKDWSDVQWIRAIREGVDDQGLPLLIMPSDAYRYLSDADVQGIVAYLRAQTPVDRVIHDRELSPLTILLIGAKLFPTSTQVPSSGGVTAPSQGPTAKYGKYLVTIMACASCHGSNLDGRTSGYAPTGPNLLKLVRNMDQATFVKILRIRGVNPNGEMPFFNISAAASDDDLIAIYNYLHSLAIP